MVSPRLRPTVATTMACCGRSGSRCSTSPRQGIARIVVFGDPGLVTLFGLALVDPPLAVTR